MKIFGNAPAGDHQKFSFLSKKKLFKHQKFEKFEIFTKKSKSWLKIDILIEILNFDKKSKSCLKILSKIDNLV